MFQTRSITFKIYPSKAQEELMMLKLLILKDLWNAALEERIGAYKRGHRVKLSDQEKALKEIRVDVGGWKGLIHTHEAQTVLKRLDLAFQGFFRRVKQGQKPGFPRFRSADRFRGWGYKEHRNGFKLEMRDGWRHGHVTLYGVGRMRIRGIARTPGRILKADVSKTHNGWRLNVVVETDCAVRDEAQGPAAGVDWGVAEFATLALEDGTFEEVPNPRHLAEEAEQLREKQQKLSRLARAQKISRRALKKARKALARRHAKVAARRKDFLHKESARMAARHPVIATEALNVKGMTSSASGTMEDPGRMVAQKAGLNRSILDTAPATFLNMLRYKAEEAGSEFLEAPTRKLKPSQRCPECGTVKKKSLSERHHGCSCGCQLGRDQAAALVLLKWGLEQISRSEPPETINPAGTVGDQAAA